MNPSQVLVLAADPASEPANALCAVLESSDRPVVSHRQYVGADKPFLRDPSMLQVQAGAYPQLIVLVDSPRSAEWLETLVQTIRGAAPHVPLMVVIENCHPTEMFRLLEAGVRDFVTPPITPTTVLPRIWQILKSSHRAKSLTETLTEELGMRQLVGASPAFLTEINKIPLIAKCNANILISGETGTGKEMCARAIHYLSPRAPKAMIPINCGATPVELLENELFGHERGAFTGAFNSQPGLIQEADGGTLFLDEIDCLPPPAQVKLLRFIQDKEYRPLGSTKIRKADVRIISATNSILQDRVREGKFRADLFFRLNIIPLRLPSLRERPDDIPLLADHFLDKFAAEFDRTVVSLSPRAMRSLINHDWPGNVRELEYTIERAIALSDQPVIDSVDVGPDPEIDSAEESFQAAKAKVVRDFEKTYIQSLLTIHSGNITRAAEVAGKNRRAFWQLIRKHGIDASQFRADPAST
jgi:two-component system, NtrC family, response regulator GlrR